MGNLMEYNSKNKNLQGVSVLVWANFTHLTHLHIYNLLLVILYP